MTSKLKVLWLSTLFVAFDSSSVAQNNSGTCEITMDRGTTVPQFCLSSLGGGPALEGPFSLQINWLNFTLNGSALVFTPLPEDRQNEVEEIENSKSWADLANILVDSIGSGSLPYGMHLHAWYSYT